MERYTRDERTEQILSAALRVAQAVGLSYMSREKVAHEAGLSDGLVSYIFGDMNGLLSAVMQRAVNDSILPIVAQGLVLAHPVAQSAPIELKRAALAELV
jgi:AcrR family transcriptional regulator